MNTHTSDNLEEMTDGTLNPCTDQEDDDDDDDAHGVVHKASRSIIDHLLVHRRDKRFISPTVNGMSWTLPTE